MWVCAGTTSHTSSRTSSRAPSVSSEGSEQAIGGVQTTVKTETRSLAGRPTTTVTFQTKHLETRTMTTPTAARAAATSRLPKPRGGSPQRHGGLSSAPGTPTQVASGLTHGQRLIPGHRKAPSSKDSDKS